MDAVKLYLKTELSYREVAKQFGINNQSLIANWKKVFLEEGIDSFSKSKGHPSQMTKPNKDNKIEKAVDERMKNLEETKQQSSTTSET